MLDLWLKTSRGKVNPEKLSTAKFDELIWRGYLMSIICAFDYSKSRYDVYKDKYCVEKSLWFLKGVCNENNHKKWNGTINM